MQYKVDFPYPEIKVTQPNLEYGQMILDNVGGMISEMSTISLYLYNHVIAGEKFQELKDIFLQICIVEMRHLDMFCELALHLGMDPRLWTCTKEYNEYWSPSYNNYPKQLKSLLENTIIGKKNVINKYTMQADSIEDENIVNFLNRILLDEKLHLKIFEDIFNQLVRN